MQPSHTRSQDMLRGNRSVMNTQSQVAPCLRMLVWNIQTMTAGNRMGKRSQDPRQQAYILCRVLFDRDQLQGNWDVVVILETGTDAIPIIKAGWIKDAPDADIYTIDIPKAGGAGTLEPETVCVLVNTKGRWGYVGGGPVGFPACKAGPRPAGMFTLKSLNAAVAIDVLAVHAPYEKGKMKYCSCHLSGGGGHTRGDYLVGVVNEANKQRKGMDGFILCGDFNTKKGNQYNGCGVKLNAAGLKIATQVDLCTSIRTPGDKAFGDADASSEPYDQVWAGALNPHYFAGVATRFAPVTPPQAYIERASVDACDSAAAYFKRIQDEFEAVHSKAVTFSSKKTSNAHSRILELKKILADVKSEENPRSPAYKIASGKLKQHRREAAKALDALLTAKCIPPTSFGTASSCSGGQTLDLCACRGKFQHKLIYALSRARTLLALYGGNRAHADVEILVCRTWISDHLPILVELIPPK